MSQNRILVNRRPHEKLKDNGIWTQRATFFRKIGVPLGVFWRFFCEKILNQKQRSGAKKGPLRADSHMVNVDMEFAPTWLRLARLADVAERPCRPASTRLTPG